MKYRIVPGMILAYLFGDLAGDRRVVVIKQEAYPVDRAIYSVWSVRYGKVHYLGGKYLCAAYKPTGQMGGPRWRDMLRCFTTAEYKDK